ncbi:MAG: hypothetical protein AB7G75_27950 [Candidatus Binatia bacterium]
MDGHTLVDQQNAIEILEAYYTIMDEVLPKLTPAEQVVYQRLFRLSHAQQHQQVRCRYEILARQCGLSLRTLQRAVRSLKQKQLLRANWQSHGATTFTLDLQGPNAVLASLRRRRGDGSPPLPARRLSRPPVYDTFSQEDRELFVTAKRSLSPARMNQITEEAVEWLAERAAGNPLAFSDELLRDKVDELVAREVFGPDRQNRYVDSFRHLYDATTDIRTTV